MPEPRARVPSLLWLWAAPAIVVAQMATKAWDTEVYRRWMRSEHGLVENLTVAFLAGAIVCGALCFLQRARVRWRLFGPLMLLMTLGLIYFAGEEMSWGQHLLGFKTPESIAERNEQQEFNLHNDPALESYLDQLPRLLLTLGALAGGVIAPLVRRRRGLHGRDFQSRGPWGWIWPTFECFPAALFAVVVALPKKIGLMLDHPVPDKLDFAPGETKEYCLALFLLVYLLSLYLALRAEPRAAAAG